MQNRRDWLRSSLGIGGLLLAPSNLLTAQEKIDFNPRPLESMIRLSSNENPYGPSKRVQERIKNSFVHGCRYPYAYSDDLESILAKKHGVSPESIIVTGGSTEGLKIAGLTFASNGGEIISGQPTFLAMMDYAKQWGATVNWVPVGADKGYDLDAIEKKAYTIGKHHLGTSFNVVKSNGFVKWKKEKAKKAKASAEANP